MLSFIGGSERREADTIKRQSDPRLLLRAAQPEAKTLNLAV